LSFNASRTRLTALFRDGSKSTKVFPQICSWSFLAGDDFARPLGQHQQNAEGLFLKADRHATLAQLHGVVVQFVDSEADLASHLPPGAYSNREPVGGLEDYCMFVSSVAANLGQVRG
jgi:hypothetical protein